MRRTTIYGFFAAMTVAIGTAPGAVVYGFEAGDTVPHVTIALGGSLSLYSAIGYGYPSGTAAYADPNSNNPATISFIPDAGFQVTILSFDVGSFSGIPAQSALFSISDGVQNDSFTASAQVNPSPPTTWTPNFMGGADLPVTTSMGPSTSWYGNLGLDNIQVEVSQVAVVPEPGIMLETIELLASAFMIRHRKPLR